MSYIIPIFDSLAHPSENGLWFGKEFSHSFSDLRKEYDKYNFIGGCSVQIPIMSEVSPSDYLKRSNDIGMYPVYYYDFKKPISQIQELKDLGYKAIKIHTRLGNINSEESIELLEEIFRECYSLDMIAFFCTLIHSEISLLPPNGLLSVITRLLQKTPKLKIVLLHGGDVDLLKFVQLARFNENILIDLSFTLQKFEGSSLDLDIEYLFKTFDRRICVGSDYPDYSIEHTRRRFDYFASKTTVDKASNIGYRNIKEFLEI